MTFRGIILFDVDGTLITCGGAGRRALVSALETHIGRRADQFFDFSFGGMTDRAIVRQALEKAEMPVDPERVEAIIKTYTGYLSGEVAIALRYRVLSGAVDLVTRLDGERTYALGLGTGNVEKGARIKLERAGLNPYFGFGGFGCDSEDRTELIAAGVSRGREAAGWDAPVLVIGDTPKDVTAAHSAGAKCFGVATGGWGLHELREAGADAVFESLATPDLVPEIDEFMA